MNKTKFVKSVGFNLKNEEDVLINKHIARRNFSGYVKKLILEDIKLKQLKKEQQQKPPQTESENKQCSPFRSVIEKPVSVQNHNRKKVVQGVASPSPLLNLQNKPMKGN